MKKSYILLALIILSAIFYGCGGIMIDEDFEQITTPLTYQQLLGTYVFKPDTFQAKKLGIKPSDFITITLTDEKVDRFKSDPVYFYGIYHISKMVFDSTNKVKKPSTGIWEFHFHGHNDPKLAYENSNELRFYKDNDHNSNITFQVGKDRDGILRIAGYAWDPRYEVIKVIDFKKVK